MSSGELPSPHVGTGMALISLGEGERGGATAGSY